MQACRSLFVLNNVVREVTLLIIYCLHSQHRTGGTLEVQGYISIKKFKKNKNCSRDYISFDSGTTRLCQTAVNETFTGSVNVFQKSDGKARKGEGYELFITAL